MAFDFFWHIALEDIPTAVKFLTWICVGPFGKFSTWIGVGPYGHPILFNVFYKYGLLGIDEYCTILKICY